MRHLAIHHNSLHYDRSTVSVYMMIFFFLMFDGIFTYMAPLVMESRGLSQVQIGYLLGSSSVAGLLADVLLAKLLHNIRAKRIFFIMLLLALLYPAFLWTASTLHLFLIAMAAWGVYWDFLNIGQLNFVSNYVRPRDHTAVYGVLHAMVAAGGIVALVVCGTIGQSQPQLIPYIGGAIFLASCLFFLGIRSKPHNTYKTRKAYAPIAFHRQFLIWRRNIKKRGGILFGLFFLNLIDAAYWQIGPYLGSDHSLPFVVRAFFMIPYQTMPLIAGLLLSGVLRKKRTVGLAKTSLFLACALLAVLFFSHDLPILIGVITASSFFIGLAFPAYWASYAHAVESNPSTQAELETLGDACVNFGYIIGPILTGYLVAGFGNFRSFGILGLVGCVFLMTGLLRHKHAGFKSL